MVNEWHETSSEQARARLVSAMRKEGTIRTDAVAQAFLAVPREAFVQVFYEQERWPGHPWLPRTSDSYAEQGSWIDAIYQDQPLVTLVDHHNTPVSSSSAPSVMAMMLEALTVSPGATILEIGTGSGYNAALLATLTGEAGLVTTIELEDILVRAATQALRQSSIGQVETRVGDGRLGIPPRRGLYDRIIATASSPDISPAWYDQLAPDGRLVLPLQGSLGKGGFLTTEKKADGEACGVFDARSLHFMPLRAVASLFSTEQRPSPLSVLLRQPVTQHIQIPSDDTAMTIFEDDAFHWYLQWALPGVTLMRSTITRGPSEAQSVVTFTDTTSTVVQLFLTEGTWRGNQRGGIALWETIKQAYGTWVDKGRPGIETYSVASDAGDRRFLLLGPCELLL